MVVDDTDAKGEEQVGDGDEETSWARDRLFKLFRATGRVDTSNIYGVTLPSPW